MFQSFDVKSDPTKSAVRVQRLRAEIDRLGLDGFLVPRADEYQGEYVAPRSKRLSYTTGFTGSAGMALIMKTTAIIFVDGRYTLQVKSQTDPAIFQYDDLVNHPPAQWLRENGSGLKIGFDPWLHTIADVANLKDALKAANGKLIAVEENPVDVIWDDQPAAPITPVSIQPLEFAGIEAKTKLATLCQTLKNKKVDAVVLTDPSSIAWTFNIRGKDVSNTPFTLSFTIIYADGKAELFIEPAKLDQQVRTYLEASCAILPPENFVPHLEELSNKKLHIALDPLLTAEKIRQIISQNGKIIEMSDPARLPRAVKNTAELAGSRHAHKRDGVALVRFFAWLDRQKSGTMTEISTAQKLETLRAETATEMGSKLEDLSFDTISGSGPNGAIIHYRVTTQTDRPLNEGELYLVDSGAQYRDGTTDVTRTVAIGEVGGQEKRCFTLVLKGMIAMSMAHFPVGTRGQDIDVLARINLWKAGLDYGHGTGHGIGSYLSVHEGPQNLSKRGTQELLPGMIISNEPGYYREDAFGIRIENLLIVKKEQPLQGGEIKMRSFETLTLCPIDRRLIAVELLTREELSWLNAYHQRVCAEISPHLNEDDKAWLKAATAEI